MKLNQEKLLKEARSLLGTPYKYAVKPEDIPAYLDCSSLTQYIYKLIGYNLERSTPLQAAQGKEIFSIEKADAGDLLFFRGSKGHHNDELFPRDKAYPFLYIKQFLIKSNLQKLKEFLFHPLETIKILIFLFLCQEMPELKGISIGHVAMYAGDNKVIHATSKRGVVEENLEKILKSHGPIVMIKRIID